MIAIQNCRFMQTKPYNFYDTQAQEESSSHQRHKPMPIKIVLEIGSKCMVVFLKAFMF